GLLEQGLLIGRGVAVGGVGPGAAPLSQETVDEPCAGGVHGGDIRQINHDRLAGGGGNSLKTGKGFARGGNGERPANADRAGSAGLLDGNVCGTHFSHLALPALALPAPLPAALCTV